MTEPERGAAEAPDLKNDTDTSSKQSYTGLASSAAGNAAETATNAAAGVKDTMFSMFGGGSKKEAPDDATKGEEEQDRSGSAKVFKEKEKEKEKAQGAAEDGEMVHEGVSGCI